MKRKPFFILQFFALLATITACQEFNELIPQSANSKENSKVLV